MNTLTTVYEGVGPLYITGILASRILGFVFTRANQRARFGHCAATTKQESDARAALMDRGSQGYVSLLEEGASVTMKSGKTPGGFDCIVLEGADAGPLLLAVKARVLTEAKVRKNLASHGLADNDLLWTVP